MRFRYCALLTLVFVIHAGCSYSQKESLSVDKKSCQLNKNKGHKIILVHKTQNEIYTSDPYSYDLSHFIKLDDSSKLVLIDMLLKYENDTSLCCLDVIAHAFNGIEGCKGDPVSKRYSLQVDALYMINRLSWPKMMELYSCYNVLYDTLTKKEINQDPAKIKILFAEYNEWFTESKKKGKIDKYFPFNTGRYVWLGGRNENDLKDN